MSQGWILVVDDEEAVRKPVSLQLRKAGYDVLEAADAEQAMSLLVADAVVIDLVLLDIRMPNVDGTELLEQFRRRLPTVPVLILTGFPDTECARSVLKYGVVNYLVKPISKEELLEAVRNAMHGAENGAKV
jgi:two-component system chemotaxis response regulator CheY